MSIRKYSYTFRVGGVKTGYDCTVEAPATNRKSAAQKIRHRIRKMPDVQSVPVFHYTEITAGLVELLSEGHDDNGFNKRTRPAKLRNKPAPILPARKQGGRK